MTDRDAFIRTILAAPADDGPRLVYADWLEENGESDRAEFIRVQCELAGGAGCSSDYCDGGQVDDDNEIQEHTCGWARRLQRRERELLTASRDWFDIPGFQTVWNGVPDPESGCGVVTLVPPDTFIAVEAWPRRGLVEAAACRWDSWVAHHAALCAATPIRRVRLTTRPDWYSDHDGITLHGGAYPQVAEPLYRCRRAQIRHIRSLREPLTYILAAEWPGVEFELPRVYEDNWTVTANGLSLRWHEVGGSAALTDFTDQRPSDAPPVRVTLRGGGRDIPILAQLRFAGPPMPVVLQPGYTLSAARADTGEELLRFDWPEPSAPALPTAADVRAFVGLPAGRYTDEEIAATIELVARLRPPRPLSEHECRRIIATAARLLAMRHAAPTTAGIT